MLTLDLKARFRNKTFIISMLGAIVLLIQQLGFKDLIPSNWSDIINTLLSILVMLGIIVDTSTKGVSDKVVQDATVQAINKAAENKDEIQIKDSTTLVNSIVTENSQSGSSDASVTSSDKESETNATYDNTKPVVNVVELQAERDALKAQLASIVNLAEAQA